MAPCFRSVVSGFQVRLSAFLLPVTILFSLFYLMFVAETNSSNQFGGSIMSDFFLPEALMLNIWLRLPIKSTVRFRCVSKSWCASFSDPHFIYKNLTFFDAENEHDLLLVLDKERQYYSVVSHETLMATPLQVFQPRAVPALFNTAVLTPSCDDLVCFNNGGGLDICVCNLTTGETKMVPRISNVSLMFTYLTLGFGFDEKRKDYKIVLILSYLGDCVAYVYSLGSGNNCWRKVAEPKMPDGIYGPVSVYSRSYRDGTFYWGASDQIVSFDMSGEVFNVISIPQHPHRSSIHEICKLKEGSMFIINRNYDPETMRFKEFDIWALLEFGVTQSWTKLFVIDWGCGNIPLGFWRNKLVSRSYSNKSRLFIRDPSKRKTKEVQIDKPLEILTCLVWTKGKNSIPLQV